MAENYINTFPCQLVSSCTNSDATISVSAAASVASGFRIRIGNELMLVTGGGTTTTWNVTRGIESTAAASHSSGDAVRAVLTKGSLDQIKVDWLSAVLPSDDFYIRDPSVSGYAWPRLRRVKLPDFTGFSWVNQKTATIAAVKSIGAYRFQMPLQAGDNFAIYLKTAPATPYTFTVMLTIESFVTASNVHTGLLFRDSSGGKISQMAYTGGQNLFVAKFNSPTSFSASYLSVAAKCYPVVYMQLADNGTTRYFRMSVDGYHFHDIYSVGRTDFHTPDQVGVYLNNSNYTTFGATILGMEFA